MKRIILIFSGILSLTFLYSQPPIDEGWVEIGNAAYNSQLYDIEFISQTTGFAVGNGGTFLKTTDGGQTWEAHNIGVNYALYQIQFTSPDNGYIRGGNNPSGNSFGKVLHTTDGGNTWTEVYTLNNNLNDIYFINDSTGFASRHALISKTTDYGQTWTNYIQPSTVYDIRKARFANFNKGVYIHNGYNIYLTEDAGETWDSTYTVTGSVSSDICYADNAHAFSLFGNRLYVSSDTGTTWTFKNNIPSSINRISFYSKLVGYGFGKEANFIYRTNDGGANFTEVYNGVGAGITSIKFMPNGDVVAVGRGGLILHSGNGTTWDTLHIGTFVGNLRDVVFIGNDIGFAVGSNGNIKKTVNGGISWEIQNLNTDNDLKGISYYSANNIFIAGDNYTLIHSPDTGKTWNSSPGPNADSEGIIMTSANEGLAYGNGIYKTTDNGSTWNQVFSDKIYSAYKLNSDISVFGGLNNIYYTSDGGNNFINIRYYSGRSMHAVYLFNADTCIYVDHWGYIYKTENRGASWKQINKYEGNDKADFCFIDDTTGYLVMNHGLIYKTSNAGDSWTKIHSGTMRNLTAICFTPDGTGYIVGDDGIILRKAAIPTYNVSFKVLNDEGDTLSNATLNFDGSLYTVGEYSVYGLESYNYPYTFTCPGHQPFSGFVNLSSDTTITVELKKYHEVKIEVSNVFTIPVAYADVTFDTITKKASHLGIVRFDQIIKSTNNTLQISQSNYKNYHSTVDIIGDTTFSIVLDANLDAPLAENAINIEDSSFVAQWKSVVNADAYILFVSDDNFDSHLLGYDFLTVQSTSHTVTGLVPKHTYYYRLKAVNNYGYSDYSNTIQLSTAPPVGINTVIKKESSVLPNPANDFLILTGEFNFGDNIVISDIMGRILQTEIFNGQRINISLLPSGIYIIMVGDKKTKFVKQ